MGGSLNLLHTFTLVFSVLFIAALAGLYSERSGVVNIAINGFMIIGALMFALFGDWMNSIHASNTTQLLGLLIAALVSGIFSLLHSFASLTLKGDQIISGTAINLLASGIGLFLCTMPFAGNSLIQTHYTEIAFDSKSKIVSLYLFIALFIGVITIIFFKFSKQGLRFKGVGQNPNVVDSTGGSVIKTRYIAVCISGALAGLAGALFTFVSSLSFNGNVQGQGFIALAIMIFGQWRTSFIFCGAFLFSIFWSFGVNAQYLPNISKGVQNNSVLFKIVPFALTIIAMMIFYKFNNMPQALGKHFNKSKR